MYIIQKYRIVEHSMHAMASFSWLLFSASAAVSSKCGNTIYTYFNLSYVIYQ